MKRYAFVETDFVVPINTTYVSPTDFTSKFLSLRGVWSAAITLYAKGSHGSCSLAAVFNFVTWDSLREMWDTVNYFSTTITMIGTTAVQKTVVFDPCPERVKLLSVFNPEVTATYTVTVNASLLCHFV